MSVDRSKAPETHEFPYRKIPAERTLVTDGRVTVHIIDRGDIPVGRVDIMYMYGSRHSTVQLGSATYANALAPMLLEGTKDMDSAALAEVFDFAGAEVQAAASETALRVSVTSLNESTPDLLRTLATVINNAALPADKFGIIALQALQKFEISQTQPARIAADRLRTVMAGEGHPYLRAARRSDFTDLSHDSLVTAWQTATAHTDLHIFFSGKLTADLEEALTDLARALRPTPATDLYTVPVTPMSALPPVTEHIDMPQSLQTAICAGIPTIGREHPDYIPLRLTVMALGGYFGSRLMTNIREEKGLTYGISAALLGTYEGAYAMISAQCAAGTGELVLGEIKSELTKLAEDGMGADELRRLRQYAASQLMGTLDTPMAIADYYINRLSVGTPADYFGAQQRAIAALDSPTLRRMAATYLRPERLRTVTCG